MVGIQMNSPEADRLTQEEDKKALQKSNQYRQYFPDEMYQRRWVLLKTKTGKLRWAKIRLPQFAWPVLEKRIRHVEMGPGRSGPAVCLPWFLPRWLRRCLCADSVEGLMLAYEDGVFVGPLR